MGVAGSLCATFISHGISFYVNFLRGHEYERTTLDELASAASFTVTINRGGGRFELRVNVR